MNGLPGAKEEVIPGDFTTEYRLPKLSLNKRPRHIFIFLDGTWNEERTPIGEATPTNVLRMFQEINHKTSHELESLSDHNDSPKIIAHYYRGVGSRQDNNAANRMWYGFNGKDEQRIRSAAFADLYQDYQNTNDCIYILGFSRGAASARLLARDICNKGFPPKLKIHTIRFPNLLTGQIEARVDSVERQDENSNDKNYSPEVAFLGCWDTVDAFVWPSRFPKQGIINKVMDKTFRTVRALSPRLWGKERFSEDENVIPERVQKAVHCVAIDETRNAFLPTLMPNADNVEEVWFPGVHSDVGGGYDDNKLAEEPYEFIKRRLLDATKILKNHLFKNPEDLHFRKRQSYSSEFCFHFHGLNTGLNRVKGLFGFGKAIRRIQVLNRKDVEVKPKIQSSLRRIMTSDSVFAADTRNKRTWTITYDPYNVRELKDEFEIVSD